MTAFETAPQFLRPSDLRGTRRNQRRLLLQRLLGIAANAAVAGLFIAAVAWVYFTAQRDARFAIHHVDTLGIRHTSQAEVDRVMSRYVGQNLFQTDLERLRREIAALPWIASVAIEKRLPDSVTLHVTEREPVALVARGRALAYVDSAGVAFAPLRPEWGNPDLPLITAAAPQQLRGCVEVLEMLRSHSPELYARLSEITPLGSDGYRIFDRDLATFVSIRPEDAIEKWTALYSIARAEKYERGSIEYADLRFAERVIVKPKQPRVRAVAEPTRPAAGVTN
jgi:cell division protein FtsQ